MHNVDPVHKFQQNWWTGAETLIKKSYYGLSGVEWDAISVGTFVAHTDRDALVVNKAYLKQLSKKGASRFEKRRLAGRDSPPH